MNNRLVVENIARATRRWALRNRHKYHFPRNLTGMCAIAAGELWKRLTVAGIKAKVAIRNSGPDSHCFVIVGDYIVDVTATQFGMKPIEIVARKQAREYFFWKPTKIHDTAQQLRNYQQKTGWPDDQISWG